MFTMRPIALLGGRRMSLSHWDEGSDSDQVTGLDRDSRLVGHCKILAVQWAKLPRYGREGAVEVRPFPAEKRLCVSEAQGLSGEAMKGNPTTTVILRADESKSTNNRRVDRTRDPVHPSLHGMVTGSSSFRVAQLGSHVPTREFIAHPNTYPKRWKRGEKRHWCCSRPSCLSRSLRRSCSRNLRYLRLHHNASTQSG